MMNTIIKTILPVFAIVLQYGLGISQDKTVLVERCKALDQTSPIHNIWVDSNNIKWVANSHGLNKVLSLDIVEKATIAAGKTSLLMIRGGNAQIEWNTNELNQLLGNATITCGVYDRKKKSVWLGTRESGAFEISLSPLRIIQQLNTGNKKLTSNQINDIFIRNNGTIYIATNDGMLTGNGEKWTLQERYLNFVGVDAWGDNMWILGDNFLWQVDNKGKWNPIAIELRNVEGQIRDIAVDDEGRVWIASNMMTGYDVAAEKYQRFGPGQYFTSQFVNCLDVDHDGSIWTGTADKGLYLIQWESSLILTIQEDTPLDCNSSDPTASLSVKVAGGQAPYSYQWNNGLATASISKLPAGTYEVTVTDASGLVKSGKYEIPEAGIDATIKLIQPSTTPEGNGSATLTVTGGTGQYIYQWDNGENAQTAVKLGAGDHSVTVTDKSGCSTVATIAVSETLAALAVTVSTQKEIACGGNNDGVLIANVTGGKPPYQYAWSHAGATEVTIASLPEGNYTVTITDAAGKSSTGSAVISAPAPLNASIEIVVPANVNAADGQATAKASGGKAPYSYAWSNGQTGATNKMLTSGKNVLTVTDASGCTAVATIEMTENITDMHASITQTGEIKCTGESTGGLAAEVSGGKGPYQFKWSNNAGGQQINNLAAGIYTVTISDASGKAATATHEVKQPDALSLIIQTESAASTDKDDGKAIAKASGGTGTYSFKWDNGESTNKAVRLTAGVHSVTVTDGSGCVAISQMEITENILALQVTIEQKADVKCADSPDAALEAVITGGKGPFSYTWSTNGTGAALSAIKGGLYTLTVTDALGHTATTAYTVDAPLPLVISAKVESAASTNGNDGKASASVTGGKGKFTYAWDNGEKTQRAEKLTAGPHSVIVTDENGCTVSAEITIPENVLPLTADIMLDNPILCFGQTSGVLSAKVTGGKEPYQYLWNHNDQTWTTPKIQNIGAGTYQLKITDVNGTHSIAIFQLNEPKAFELAVDNVTPASMGNNDGKAVLKITGGTLPYQYGNAIINANTLYTVDNLSPGTHSLAVTDASGCRATSFVTITENISSLSVSIEQTSTVKCTGASDGTLTAKATGGKPPYTFAWDNGSQSGSLNNIPPGTYSVTVKDAAGQEAKAQTKLEAPTPFIVEVVNLRSATNDRISDGKGSVEIKGGSGPYTYSWSSGEKNANASKLPIGQGRVVVTDNNGCTAVAEYLVKEKVLPELTASRLASGEPIRMEKIQFEADSVNINAEAIPSLDELYEFLYDNPTTIIEVAGHTNGLPADDYCDRISAERAQEVANYLIDKGIESRRVISKGYGKRKPVATNQTPEGRRKNQRVEIRLIKIEE